MKTARRLRLGVAGMGSIGRRHARLLAERPDVELHTYDPVAAPLDEADLGTVATDFDALLHTARDGVVIATPDHLHGPMVIAACAAGVPSLVEKPVADDLAVADAMNTAARESGVPVLVGHILRYTSTLRGARSLLVDGAIGAPVSFHTSLGAYETLEVARSRFNDQDRFRLVFDYSHEWDYLQWLLGPARRVVTTTATAFGLDLVQQPNAIDSLLELESGAIGSVHLDYVERHGARGTRIIGDQGVLTLDLRAGSVVLMTDGEVTKTYDHSGQRDDLFRAQIDHFLAVVQGDESPGVTISDGRAAIAVAAAVVASAKTGTWHTVERPPQP